MVDGIIEAIERVVVVATVLNINLNVDTVLTGSIGFRAQLLIIVRVGRLNARVRYAVSIFRNTVEVVSLCFAFARRIGKLRDFEQTAVFAHRRVVVPNVSRQLRGLRAELVGTVAVTPFIVMVYELIGSHIASQEVISHELVDRIVFVLQICDRAVTEMLHALGINHREDCGPVGNISCTVKLGSGNAPIVLESGVGFNKGRITDGTLGHVREVEISEALGRTSIEQVVGLVNVIDVLLHLVCPTRFVNQARHYREVRSLCNQIGQEVVRRSNDLANNM